MCAQILLKITPKQPVVIQPEHVCCSLNFTPIPGTLTPGRWSPAASSTGIIESLPVHVSRFSLFGCALPCSYS